MFLISSLDKIWRKFVEALIKVDISRHLKSEIRI